MALLAYNRKKQFLAPDVEGLIKQLTGFEEDSKNYQEVAKFLYSNIIHHNFATVDTSAVQRSIEGIAEKLKIHGFTSRGRRLQELVNKYVSSDSSQHSQLNVQWHVLLLLLKLSYNPTSVSEDALKAVENVLEPSEPEEVINWSDYLKEGWEDFRCPSDNSDDDEELWLSASEDEEVEEPSACSRLLHLPRTDSSYETVGYGGVPHPSLWKLQPAPISRQEAVRKLTREAIQSEQWLHNHVQNSWWKDSSYKNVPESKYSSAQMCEIWEKHVVSKQGRDSSPLSHTKVVAECKLLQEVLWMLLVPVDSSLFRLDSEGLFILRPNLSLPTTTPDTTRFFLEDMCPYINMVNKLRKFEEELSKQEMSEKPPPVTYKAYCAALFQQLNNFNKLVIEIENKHNKQEETMTLISVVAELSPGLHILHYLYDIHTRAVTDWTTQASWLCATRLLSVLYEALLETSDQMCLEAALYIFIHSFHIYLDIIDVWLTEGRLEDWRKEFLVIREEGELCVMPYEQKMRECGVVPVTLLTKLVNVVRDAGRTMEVVSQLNKLPQLRNLVDNKGCLFKQFSDNVYNEIERLKENIHKEPVVSEVNSAENITTNVNEKNNKIENVSKSDFDVHNLVSITDTSLETYPRDGEGENVSGFQALSNNAIYDQMVAVLLDNPLLYEALHSYLHSGEPASHSEGRAATPTHSLFSESAQSVSLVGLMSLHSVLERQLELVVTRHSRASQLVTDTLRLEYNLQEHFTVLRTVLFMEAGNLAQSFYSYLFKEIESGMWNNSLSLSVQLQLCVEEFYPGFGNLFTVLVTDGEQTCDVHRAIQAISLAYRVDWPVSSVITQDTIDSYNKVFRFLLHLKYAFWTLHNIRFSDLYSSPNLLRVRRLHVIKLWMYHSTNTLHAYFMGQVLRSFSTHLENSISKATSIQVIVQAHNKFLDEVKVHCLQDKKSPVETFIMKLLRLCSTLAHLWEEEAASSLTDSDIHRLEQQYMIAYCGLLHCLEAITADGNTDHVLCELKNEISHSVPEPYAGNN